MGDAHQRILEIHSARITSKDSSAFDGHNEAMGVSCIGDPLPIRRELCEDSAGLGRPERPRKGEGFSCAGLLPDALNDWRDGFGAREVVRRGARC